MRLGEILLRQQPAAGTKLRLPGAERERAKTALVAAQQALSQSDDKASHHAEAKQKLESARARFAAADYAAAATLAAVLLFAPAADAKPAKIRGRLSDPGYSIIALAGMVAFLLWNLALLVGLLRREAWLGAAFAAVLLLGLQTDVIGVHWLAVAVWGAAGVALGSARGERLAELGETPEEKQEPEPEPVPSES